MQFVFHENIIGLKGKSLSEMESKELNKRYFYLLFASKHTTPILEMTFVTLNNTISHLPKILIYNTFAPIKQKCKFLDIYCL